MYFLEDFNNFAFMRTQQSLIIIFIFSWILLAGCDEELTRTKWYPNPNGDSELALLMREMHDDVLMMKKSVEAKQVPRVRIDHTKIFTAIPTEQGKVESQEYKDNGKLYLQAIESIRKSNYKNARENYKNVVGSCISCHRSVCPGPVDKIENLLLEEEV
jgi:hypothetical protein